MSDSGSSSSTAIVAIMALVILAGAAWFVWGRGADKVIERDTTIIERHDDRPSIDVDIELPGPSDE